MKLHLKYICPHCKHNKRETRDLLNEGKCFWNKNWKKGIYDEIPTWMGIINFFRLYIFRKPIKICINGTDYKGKDWKGQ